MQKLTGIYVLIFALLAPGAPLTVAAQETGSLVTRTGTVDDDLYLAGGQVNVLAEVRGDVLVAGGQVSVDNRVSGDVMAAGGNVAIRARVDDDVRAAGGSVSLDGTIGGDAVVAGGSVRLAPGARVSGRAWLSGANVVVAGRVGRELRVAGGTVVIAGEIDGNAEVIAEHVQVADGAVIRGDLTYSSPGAADIHPGARIQGATTAKPFGTRHGAAGWIGCVVVGLICLVTFTLSATVVYYLFPNVSRTVLGSIEAEPWPSLGLGLAVFVTVPFVIILLAVTVVALPLALLLGALYLLVLVGGLLAAIVWLGERIFRVFRRAPVSTGARILSILAAVAVVGVVRWIPVLGSLAVFVLMLFGLGALTLTGYRVYAGTAPRPSPGRRKKKSPRRRS
jgi:cytoskeletal protein CcmA (bactofilin family)